MKLVLSVFVTTSLFAQCSSVSTEVSPLRFTDDFFPEPECDIENPCADPNECCSIQGTCGADQFSCGIGCVAGPCTIFCGYPDNMCNPNECCSITFECGVGEDYCGTAAEPDNPPTEPVPCTNNDQCKGENECCAWIGFCLADEDNTPFWCLPNDGRGAADEVATSYLRKSRV